MTKLLAARGLSVEISVRQGLLRPVQSVNLEIDQGETLALVGESGCGKSMTALAIMGLLPAKAKRQAVELTFAETNLLGLNERQMAGLRGSRVSMIFQEPMLALNPAYTIGNQLIEVHRRHTGVSRFQSKEKAIEMLGRVGISAASSRLGLYPHQLSGGQRQRVMIAMALICNPELVIADEPTTALDVTIQAQILQLLVELIRDTGAGLVIITHDLGIVARMADRVAVMYAGQVVEVGPTSQVFVAPAHPYTKGLLDCIPVPGRKVTKLGSIPGIVPTLLGEMNCCHFAQRCSFAQSTCQQPIDMRHASSAEHHYRCLISVEPSRLETIHP